MDVGKAGWIRAAVSLDLFELTVEYSSESYQTLTLAPSALPRRGIAIRILAFFWHLLRDSAAFWRAGRPTIEREAVVHFANSKNERDVLERVVPYIPGASLVGRGDPSSHAFPWVSSYLLAAPFLPLVLYRFFTCKGYTKRAFYYVFDQFWHAYGLYLASRRWIRGRRPRAVVLANQFSMPHRVLMQAARDEGVPTFYLQHAAQPHLSPPLHVDFALLEGRDSLDKLVRAGTSRPRAFLVGMPKLDVHLRRVNHNADVRRIGICTNGLDPLDRAAELCGALRAEFPSLELRLRPHNADRRTKEWRRISERYGMEYSDFDVEISFHFLSRVDAILSGDSGILLEAALLDVYAIYYDFPGTATDLYGFCKAGLIDYARDLDGLLPRVRELLRKKPSIRHRTRPYCATIGTAHEGRSAALAGSLIERFARNGTARFDGWSRLADAPIEAYEPSEAGP